MFSEAGSQVTGTQTKAERQAERDRSAETTVTVRCTGHVRTRIRVGRLEYTSEGDTLGAFLAAFFEDHDVKEMLIAETEEEAMTDGWAPEFGELPGENYVKNPEGEQSRRFARVLVNGIFNEHIDGLDIRLGDEDRVTLIYPFIYCC
jgi:molybdopterin converting factor small subunit